VRNMFDLFVGHIFVLSLVTFGVAQVQEINNCTNCIK